MKKSMAILLICVVSFTATNAHALWGKKTIHLTYYSQPSGAAVYESGQYLGTTPITLTYKIKPACTPVKAVNVRWASGATATTRNLSICKSTGKYQQYVFTRPIGFAGLEADIQSGAQSERNAILKQQAADAETSALIDSIGDSINSYNQNKKTTTHCTSSMVGYELKTVCR